MWVLTQDGELVNLAHVSRIQAEEDYAGYHAVDPRWVVVAYEAGWRENEDGDIWHSQRHVLGQCDDEEHGKRITGRLFSSLADGKRIVSMEFVARPECVVCDGYGGYDDDSKPGGFHNCEACNGTGRTS